MPEENDAPSTQGNEATEPKSWEEYLAAQPDTVKSLYEEHVKGLKSALKTEREQREQFQKDLKDAIQKLDKNSETRKELEGIQAKSEEALRKVEIYEALHAAGVKNLRLGYLAVLDGELVDAKGNIRVETLKETHPELFGAEGKKPLPKGNAGEGTNAEPQNKGKAKLTDVINALRS